MTSKNKCYSQPYNAQNCTGILIQIQNSIFFPTLNKKKNQNEFKCFILTIL